MAEREKLLSFGGAEFVGFHEKNIADLVELAGREEAEAVSSMAGAGHEA